VNLWTVGCADPHKLHSTPQQESDQFDFGEMVKPSAGYRPLAYSSPEPVQTTGTVADLFPRMAGAAKDPRLTRSHVIRRIAQGRNAGRIKDPSLRTGSPGNRFSLGPNFGPKHRGTCRNRWDEAANPRTATHYVHNQGACRV
jgi:hypothetical protein